MKLRDLIENNLTLPTSDLISPEGMQQIARGWTNHHGDDKVGYYWLNEFIDLVNQLHSKGGELYRIVFLQNAEDINERELGWHWTVDQSQIVDYIDSIKRELDDPSNAGDPYLVTAIVSPYSITVNPSLVAGQPTEWEVSITKQSAIIDYKINRYFE
jgi:hypothetical protein